MNKSSNTLNPPSVPVKRAVLGKSATQGSQPILNDNNNELKTNNSGFDNLNSNDKEQQIVNTTSPRSKGEQKGVNDISGIKTNSKERPVTSPRPRSVIQNKENVKSPRRSILKSNTNNDEWDLKLDDLISDFTGKIKKKNSSL
jgi:hypothetical protein